MTTKITVDAHAGWPVKVTEINPDTHEPLGQEWIVNRNTTREFYIHGNPGGRGFIITEMTMEGKK